MNNQSVRLDRGLTIGGRGRGETGELSPATRDTYTRLWRRFEAWCRSSVGWVGDESGTTAHAVAGPVPDPGRAGDMWTLCGRKMRLTSEVSDELPRCETCERRAAAHRRPIPATPETVALYAGHLAQNGYARQTALMHVTAIRWRHRLAGESPPDGVAAWYVLGEHQLTRRRIEEARVQPVRHADLLRIRDACVDGSVRGRRDWALVMLTYTTSAPLDQLASLDLADVDDSAAELTIRLHRQTPDGRELLRVVTTRPAADRRVCAVRAVSEWLAELRQRAVVAGPVLRAIDRHGHVAGCGVRPLSRLRRDHLARMLRAVLQRARVGESDRPVFALRLGGAMDARVGGASRLEVAARLGYAPDSATLLDYLVQWEEEGDG